MKVLLTIAALMLCYAPEVLAGDIETLDSMIIEAMGNNPEIRLANLNTQSAEKFAIQEGALPNPIVGGRIKNVGFSEITIGDDPRSDWQLFLRQEIPFPGKLRLKQDAAQEMAETKRWNEEVVKQELISNLRQTYYDWYFVSKAIEITERNKKLLENFLDVTVSRYEVGMGIQQDVIKAQVEISGFIEKLLLLNNKKNVTESRLRDLLHRGPDTRFGSPEDIGIADLNLTAANLTDQARDSSPTLKSISKKIESKQRSLDLAKKQYYPDILLEGTYFNRDGGSNDLDDIWQIGVGLRVPAYFWKRERPGVERASIELSGAKNDFADVESNVIYQVENNYLNADTALQVIKLYKSAIIPQSRLSLESSISAYQVGDIDFLTLLDSLITLFNLEIEYEKQLTEYNKSIARIEAITGVAITDSPQAMDSSNNEENNNE